MCVVHQIKQRNKRYCKVHSVITGTSWGDHAKGKAASKGMQRRPLYKLHLPHTHTTHTHAKELCM